MKTIQEVKQEIEDVIKEANELTLLDFEGDTKKMTRYRNKLSDKVSFMRTVVMYLEDEPRQEFVQKEHERLTEKKRLIDEGYLVWKKNEPADIHKTEDKWIARYHQVMDVATVNAQLRMLTYILNQ